MPQAGCAYISRGYFGKDHRRYAAARQPALSAVIVNNPGIIADDLIAAAKHSAALTRRVSRRRRNMEP
jgi:hypothetical protein